MAGKDIRKETIFDVTAVWNGDTLDHIKTRLSTSPAAPHLLADSIRMIADQESVPEEDKAILVMGIVSHLLDMFGREELDSIIDHVEKGMKEFEQNGTGDEEAAPEGGIPGIIQVPFNLNGPKS